MQVRLLEERVQACPDTLALLQYVSRLAPVVAAVSVANPAKTIGHAHEHLTFTEGMGNAVDPALWQRDLTGAIASGSILGSQT